MIGLDYVDRKGAEYAEDKRGEKPGGIPWTMRVCSIPPSEGEIFGHLPLLCRDGGRVTRMPCSGPWTNHATVPVASGCASRRGLSGTTSSQQRPRALCEGGYLNPCQPVRFREDNGWLVRFTIMRSASP